MVGLYWITVLSRIDIFLATIAVIFMILFGLLALISTLNDKYYDNSNFLSKFTKRCYAGFIAGILVLFIDVFIPSKQDMYLIWGVGSTIDYLKSNDTAKQLPDKAIQALDKWADSFNKENYEKANN